MEETLVRPDRLVPYSSLFSQVALGITLINNAPAPHLESHTRISSSAQEATETPLCLNALPKFGKLEAPHLDFFTRVSCLQCREAILHNCWEDIQKSALNSQEGVFIRTRADFHGNAPLSYSIEDQRARATFYFHQLLGIELRDGRRKARQRLLHPWIESTLLP